jgi:hydroxyacylglutathione hydrolase
MILVQAIPTYSNHFQWALWHHGNEQIVAVVDPTDADAIFDWLDHGLMHDGMAPKVPRTIESVLITSRKLSDLATLEQIRNRFDGVKVFDAQSQAQTATVQPSDPQIIEVVGAQAQIIQLLGHSSDAVAFWFKDDTRIFTGSTISSIGCASFVVEQAKNMFHSLQKIVALPDFTMMYCAQEVTEINCQFALFVDPDNRLLQQRAEEVKALRAVSKSTVPTSIGLERLTNPFLRVDELSFANAEDMHEASAAELLFTLQTMKLAFR